MVYCMGEMLIDMIPDENGHFEPCPGGAPANVAAGVAKLGGNSAFIGAISKDGFGQMLYSTLEKIGVNMSLVHRVLHKTSLAFVMLNNGERSFEFYRNPGADTLYPPEKLPENFLTYGDILHFGSVALSPSMTRDTHLKALKQARRQGAIISFDVNLRFNLWENEAFLRRALNDFLPFADIVKMSDEEYSFVTGCEKEEDAADFLLSKSAEVVIISRGKNGAAVYLKNGTRIVKPAYSVAVCDTVGAGDALMSSVLNSVDGAGERDLKELNWDMILEFANAVAAVSVSQKGGISSLPTFKEAMEFVEQR